MKVTIVYFTSYLKPTGDQIKDDVSVSSVSQEELIRLEQRLAGLAEEKEQIHSKYQALVSVLCTNQTISLRQIASLSCKMYELDYCTDCHSVYFGHHIRILWMVGEPSR